MIVAGKSENLKLVFIFNFMFYVFNFIFGSKESSNKIKISSSASAAELFRAIWSDNLELREEFKILLFNRTNHVIGWFNVSIGGVASTVVDPKVIFSVALKCNASGIILARNHPSGNFKSE